MIKAIFGSSYYRQCETGWIVSTRTKRLARKHRIFWPE